MVKCNFCQKTLEQGTGKMYVKKDGTIFYFCSSKCEKNLIKMRRNPRTVTWTGEYARVKKTTLEEKAKKQ